MKYVVRIFESGSRKEERKFTASGSDDKQHAIKLSVQMAIKYGFEGWKEYVVLRVEGRSLVIDELGYIDPQAFLKKV